MGELDGRRKGLSHAVDKDDNWFERRLSGGRLFDGLYQDGQTELAVLIDGVLKGKVASRAGFDVGDD